ncbi:universal stress protein [Bradyrhizobium sp.]|uniref:universal stress protein n=1 Tax=Bradyrhizobium sp. TaxID=376 RepID=UPI003C5928B4
MPIKDVLLPLVGEPTRDAIAAIDKCVAVAGDFGAKVSAVAIEEDILVRPKVVVSSGTTNAAVSEAVRSVTDAQGLLKAFDAAAVRFSVRNEQKRFRMAAAEVALGFAECARLKDLSLVPVKPDDGQSERIVERLLFESGRPVLMCPELFAAELPVVFDRVLIAWDHSAPSARAVADALPMLQSAATVSIVTATDSKTPAQLEAGLSLVAHLAEHGVKASFETIKIDGSSIGKVFEAHVNANAIDLLVMGAYHHSRLNETVWGGATKTVIGRPPCWVMMSR